MKRLLIIAFALLLALMWASPAQADTVREVIPVHDAADTDVCGYPAHLTYDGTIIRTTTTDADGTTRVREVYPTFRVTMTNLDSGEVYEAAIPGALFQTFHPEGSFSVVGTGIWQLDFVPGSEEEQGLFIVKGKWSIERDASGPVTESQVGTTINLCELLA